MREKMQQMNENEFVNTLPTNFLSHTTNYEALNRALYGEYQIDLNGNYFDQNGTFIVSSIDLQAYAQYVQIYGFPTAPSEPVPEETNATSEDHEKKAAKAKQKTKKTSSSKETKTKGRKRSRTSKDDTDALKVEIDRINAEIDEQNPFTLQLYPIDQTTILELDNQWYICSAEGTPIYPYQPILDPSGHEAPFYDPSLFTSTPYAELYQSHMDHVATLKKGAIAALPPPKKKRRAKGPRSSINGVDGKNAGELSEYEDDDDDLDDDDDDEEDDGDTEKIRWSQKGDADVKNRKLRPTEQINIRSTFLAQVHAKTSLLPPSQKPKKIKRKKGKCRATYISYPTSAPPTFQFVPAAFDKNSAIQSKTKLHTARLQSSQKHVVEGPVMSFPKAIFSFFENVVKDEITLSQQTFSKTLYVSDAISVVGKEFLLRLKQEYLPNLIRSGAPFPKNGVFDEFFPKLDPDQNSRSKYSVRRKRVVSRLKSNGSTIASKSRLETISEENSGDLETDSVLSSFSTRFNDDIENGLDEELEIIQQNDNDDDEDDDSDDGNHDDDHNDDQHDHHGRSGNHHDSLDGTSSTLGTTSLATSTCLPNPANQELLRKIQSYDRVIQSLDAEINQWNSLLEAADVSVKKVTDFDGSNPSSGTNSAKNDMERDSASTTSKTKTSQSSELVPVSTPAPTRRKSLYISDTQSEAILGNFPRVLNSAPGFFSELQEEQMNLIRNSVATVTTFLPNVTKTCQVVAVRDTLILNTLQRALNFTKDTQQFRSVLSKYISSQTLPQLTKDETKDLIHNLLNSSN